LTDDRGVLTVRMHTAADVQVGLTFEGYFAYRKRDEGDCLAELHDISAQGVIGRWFYEVEASEFLEWFHAKSFDVRQNQAIRHFLLATQNDFIDILSSSAPLIGAPQP